jgi:hypothetical protein
MQDHPEPGCRICDRYFTQDDYNRLWGGSGLRAPRGPCVHLGAEVDRRLCGSCRGKVELKVFGCAIHGRCTLGKRTPDVPGCCDGGRCKEYAPPDPFRGQTPVKNLLMHVLPVSMGGAWRRNVDQILRRIGLFDGRRIVAICASAPPRQAMPPRMGRASWGWLDHPDEVRKAFRGHDVEFVEVVNDRGLREVATFPELFGRLENRDPLSVTFYCHAKGVTRPLTHPAQRWADVLYEVGLDYWPLVEAALRTHPVAGPFKRHIHGWSESESEWHFSGSFWWMRDADLFARPGWRRIDRFWSGIEPYLSLHFRKDEAAGLFHDFHKPGGGLYDGGYWRDVVEPELERWKAEHAADRREWSCTPKRLTG